MTLLLLLLILANAVLATCNTRLLRNIKKMEQEIRHELVISVLNNQLGEIDEAIEAIKMRAAETKLH